MLGGTYDGINGGGNAPPGRPPGTGGLPPGRFGMAGAARDVAGGGGGPRLVPCFCHVNESCTAH